MAESNHGSSSEWTIETSKQSERGSNKKWSTLEEIRYDSVHDSSFLQHWRIIFLGLCVLAVLLDPLFLYLPVISQDMKCLGLDENLKKSALILRSITDLFYVMDIIIQLQRSKCDNFLGLVHKFRQSRSCCSKFQFIWNSFVPALAKMIWWSYISVDVLAILPLPQILILSFYSKMRGSRSLNTRLSIMNFFVMMQYAPRIFRIYQLCKEPKRRASGESTAVWVKGVLNLFMYILASHVLGAVWYFLAIQRMIVCWQYACLSENGCDTITFSCHDHGSFVNINSLSDLCPIDEPNAKIFDFGIFISIFQSGLPRSTDFLRKFSNCFCWGLRNLSSLGSNLQPSTNTWENFFVAFVSIMGLLLFIYLIGNLQTYMQLETTRVESHRHKMKVKRKIQDLESEIELWLCKSGVPKNPREDTKLQIMEKVQQEIEENGNATFEYIISILPTELRVKIKSFSPWNRLKQVLVLESTDDEVLKVICEHLKPMRYMENSIIIQEDEPIEMMLIIVDGLVSIQNRDRSSNTHRGAGELFGQKLLDWPATNFFPNVLPSATESAWATGDVEALVLMADDMKSIGFKFRSQFRKYAKFKGGIASYLETARFPCRVFTAKELKMATNNYHESRIIGVGGSATFYKGILPDNRAVAIKKFKIFSESSYKNEDVKNEVKILSQLNHKNLVRVLGCCLESEVPSLILEFMANGNVQENILRKEEGSTLSLELRVKIAAETAGALAYLHSLTPVPVIHRDVKTANILLDENYTAKLTDFGVSHLGEEEPHWSKTHVSTIVKGTFGYLDPEYYMSQQLTDKSDVYSFGVVLAELLTSRKALARDRPRNEMNLAEHLARSVREGFLDKIVDHEIVNERNIGIVNKVALLACMCLQEHGVDRPSMTEVAWRLEELLAIGTSQIKTDDMLGSPPAASSNAFIVESDDDGSPAARSYAESDDGSPALLQLGQIVEGSPAASSNASIVESDDDVLWNGR